MSQKDASESLGISKSYLSEIESNKKTPSLDLLERYSQFFRIPLSSIVLFSEVSENPKSIEKFRSYAADKILKILEWIESATDVDDGGAEDDETKAGRLLPVRSGVASGSRASIENN